ncbi:hypothetical protein EWM64_g3873 [Hericium alpestre]|uniref:Uncharacterized protein n=1 Tax=Hericium alpestre TaxID=135208 RepID=A0A4Z0A108_9AGAM|nr:hypothetical protein EWM64_g3873 [Hericium alpestre]
MNSFRVFAVLFLPVVAFLYSKLSIPLDTKAVHSLVRCADVDFSKPTPICAFYNDMIPRHFVISEMLAAAYTSKLPRDSLIASYLLQFAAKSHHAGSELQQVMIALHDVGDRFPAASEMVLDELEMSLYSIAARSMDLEGKLMDLSQKATEIRDVFTLDLAELLNTSPETSCRLSSSQVVSLGRLVCFISRIESMVAESTDALDVVATGLEEEIRAFGESGLDPIRPGLDVWLAMRVKELAINVTNDAGLKKCSDMLTLL